MSGDRCPSQVSVRSMVWQRTTAMNEWLAGYYRSLLVAALLDWLRNGDQLIWGQGGCVGQL
jgi:hypothetical protein